LTEKEGEEVAEQHDDPLTPQQPYDMLQKQKTKSET
jgi:hypothetical protein